MFLSLRGVVLAAIAAVVPLTAARAEKTNYGWCEIQVRGGNPYYQTGVLEIPSGASSAAEREFGEFARQNFDSSIDWNGSCWPFYSSLSDAKSHLAQRKSVIENDEHKAIKFTDWVGNYAPTGHAPQPDASGPHLTVVTDTSMIDARKKQEQAELDAQRDQAASLAKRIADTARNDAVMQAKRAKMFEEMRKRGSAQ